jgi:catecholate siderophore receptor
MKTQRLTVAAAAVLAIAARYQSHGQSATNTLDKVIVEGVPLEESIMPTARPINSVFGTDMSILETPRSVNLISREELTAINIQDPRDFSKVSASSYTRSNFGAPTTPDLRGQTADTYVNGMRVALSSNGNGLPWNFNAIESVNIVLGPATAVYGPSQYVGGYVDIQTKKPYFDQFRGEVAGWYGMFDQNAWMLDFGGPISKKTAYRVSYSGMDAGSYYYDGFRRQQAIYAALTHQASDRYEIQFNNEFFWANYTENFGVNRPTRDLIENNRYITGVNNNPAPDFAAWPFGYGDSQGRAIDFGNVNVPAGPAAPVSDPQNSRWITSGFPVVNRLDLGPTVDLDRRLRVLRPGDDSEGISYNGQVIQTFRPGGDYEIGNNTFFRYVRRETQSSYYYSEIIDPSWSLQNRTELRYSGQKHSFNAGLDIRYQTVRAFNDFFTEPAAVWDITRDRNFINVFNSVNFPNPFTSVPVPGWENRYYTPDNGDSGVSKSLFVGPFWQHTFKLTDDITFIGGVRADLLATDFSVAWTNPAGAQRIQDSTSIILPSGNASVNYAWTKGINSYFTYNWSQNPAGATGNGGGITTQGNASYSNTALRTEAELFELGTKFAFLDDRLFFSVAGYEQTRVNVNTQTRLPSEFRTRGIELGAKFQPNRSFYTSINYSYMDSVVKYNGNGALFDVGNTTFTSPTDRFFLLPDRGTIRRQGVPQHLVNLLADYRLDCGAGLTASLVATGDIWNNVAGSLVIPAQYQLDLSVYYTHKRFDARIMLMNVTDQKNWSAPNAVYGNESIVAELPFNIQGRVAIKF